MARWIALASVGTMGVAFFAGGGLTLIFISCWLAILVVIAQKSDHVLSNKELVATRRLLFLSTVIALAGVYQFFNYYWQTEALLGLSVWLGIFAYVAQHWEQQQNAALASGDDDED